MVAGPQSCRELARQYPILGLPCFAGIYCSSVSFGRRVLDGLPWRWFPRPHRSWLVPWWATRQPILASTDTNAYTLTLSLSLTQSNPELPGQLLLSLIYPLYLPAVTLHACSQDSTHDRRPNLRHCWILRIQRARPTLPRQGSFCDVI